MPLRFENRTALVTGVTSGFGRAIAIALLKDGARVIGTGRRTDRLDSLAAEMGTDMLLTQTLDMTDLPAVDTFVASLPEAFQPDILINNAGLALGMAQADEASLEDWDRMIQTNISGLVHLTRSVLPAFRTRSRADIINMSSIAGTYPYPSGNVYCATKAFVTQFSLALRADLLGSNVRVTNIEPGMAETEFSNVRFHGDDAKADSVYQGVDPLTPDDIARVTTDILALPPHVNINRIEVMPVQQAFGPFAVTRR
ncbi:SDR family NAD(P)-dependent oxidoreductase [Parvularcula sp. LCG005]|uniref:SDR family NAD(P)-dependent oxidoreductase n=1 Tax=Parvularcula sp. LCG005 TaxID=3078805 RepID=UPI002943DE7C|nr:SDR family NAD(P)-dependent oxidoreductase [Parvularcula sp. LCG005]WOI53434.1 SDR family NAD(P)-dependent oxidoreductase [Parvularcula sp. LCG005]